jgi:hypothetical protein
VDAVNSTYGEVLEAETGLFVTLYQVFGSADEIHSKVRLCLKSMRSLLSILLESKSPPLYVLLTPFQIDMSRIDAPEDLETSLRDSPTAVKIVGSPIKVVALL